MPVGPCPPLPPPFLPSLPHSYPSPLPLLPSLPLYCLSSTGTVPPHPKESSNFQGECQAGRAVRVAGQGSEAGGRAGVRAVRQLQSMAGGPSHMEASGNPRPAALGWGESWWLNSSKGPWQLWYFTCTHPGQACQSIKSRWSVHSEDAESLSDQIQTSADCRSVCRKHLVKSPEALQCCSHLKRGQVWDGKCHAGGIRNAAVLFHLLQWFKLLSFPAPRPRAGSCPPWPPVWSTWPSSCRSASAFRHPPALGSLWWVKHNSFCKMSIFVMISNKASDVNMNGFLKKKSPTPVSYPSGNGGSTRSGALVRLPPAVPR